MASYTRRSNLLVIFYRLHVWLMYVGAYNIPLRIEAKTVKTSHSTNGICITVSKLRILRHTHMMRVVLNAVSTLINNLCYDFYIFNNYYIRLIMVYSIKVMTLLNMLNNIIRCVKRLILY
jgi:hypothetical protein